MASAAARDRYTFGEVLGRGGMGVVRAAYDAVRGHDVAIKQLTCAGLSAERRARVTALFEREYHTLSQLSHPQIIAVYDYGIDADGPYYTMERLSGRSLKTLAPLPWASACALVRDAASALAVLHSRRLVHRDVTPANIQLALDDRAKLIDFGAMLPAGPARQVVGTGPFIAPECLQQQALDARTDIYSLGACLYYALTGRHAYPARSMRDLPRAWQTPPPRPALLGKDIPEPLERLVFDMLALDVNRRPRGIGEVFERLTAIAGLPRTERAEAAQAYLINPELVGRDAELKQLGLRVRRTARGHGRSLLVLGDPGTGRSRLLDAGVVEAKLRGLTIVRARAGDGQGAPLGVARRLLAALIEERPAVVQVIAAEDRSALLGEESAPLLLDDHARERAIEVFAHAMLTAGAARALAIVVDDIDQIDEPSCACLASLAARIRKQPIALIASALPQPGARGGAALALLEESSLTIALHTLDERQARAFLASLFGDVPNLELLAEIARRACAGNPQALMDGARELVERQLVRYEAGHWLIASDPEGLLAALAHPAQAGGVLERLSADAVDLLEVLALDRGGVMSLADFPALTAHGDSRRANHALTELVAASVLIPADDDRYGFAREQLRTAIHERMEPAARARCHVRLAERCAGLGLAPIYVAYHFIRAREFARAAPAIDAFADFIERFPGADIVRNPIVLEGLLGMVDAPPGTYDRAFIANHGAGFVINAVYQGQPEVAQRHVPRMHAALAWFTGIAEYHALADLPPGDRLTRALTVAQERCQQAARPGFDPVQALRRQSQLALTTAVCARFMADPGLFAAIPDLRPYAVLSPVLGLVVRLLDAMAHMSVGRELHAWAGARAAHAELRALSDEATDPLTRMSLHRVALGLLCWFEAEYGTDDALVYIDELASVMANLAESCRARFHHVRGELALADAARRRFEVLSVQANSVSDARIAELSTYLTLYALADDLIGLTRTLHALERVARTRPNWQARVRLARSHMLRCRGELDAALAEIEAALAAVEPGNSDWLPTATLHVTLLEQTGRHEQARATGERQLARARSLQLPCARLELALAAAYAELDDPDAAERCYESARAALEACGARGLHMRHCLGVGARLALRRSDHALYTERKRERSAHSPSAPPLAGDATPADTNLSAVATLAAETRCVPFETALSRLKREESVHAETLRLLCEYTDALGGALYSARGERIERVAVTGELGAVAGLDVEVVALFARELTSSSEATVAGGSDSFGEWTALRARTDDDWELVPYSLIAERDGVRQLAGVVVLAFEDAEDAAVAHGWLSAVASILLDAGAGADGRAGAT